MPIEQTVADTKVINDELQQQDFKTKCAEIRSCLEQPYLTSRERDALHATMRVLYESNGHSHDVIVGCDGILRKAKG